MLELLLSFFFLTPQPALADIAIPVTYAENCLVITNLDDYPEYTFEFFSTGPTGVTQQSTISNEQCFASFAIGATTAKLVATSVDAVVPVELVSEQLQIPNFLRPVDSFSGTGKKYFYTVAITGDQLTVHFTESVATHDVYPARQTETSESLKDLLQQHPDLLMLFEFLVVMSLVGLVVIVILVVKIRKRRARQPHL